MTEWHVPPVLARGYVEGSVPDGQAWSVEAHLVGCARCREVVGSAAAEHPPVGALLAEVGDRLAAGLDAGLAEGIHAGADAGRLDQGLDGARLDLGLDSGRLHGRPGPRPGRPRLPPSVRRSLALLGLRHVSPSWLGAVAAMLASALLLDLFTTPWQPGSGGGGAAARWFDAGGSWLVLTAPLLPVLGVALAHAPGLDPSFEITAATPSAGLRLLLWRTLSVLVVALPAAGLSDALLALLVPARSVSLLPWLFPALVLTVTVLAAGSLVGSTVAAVAVGATWAAGTLAPVLVGAAPVLLTVVPDQAWLVLVAAAVAVIVSRRHTLVPVFAVGPSGGTPV